MKMNHVSIGIRKNNRRIFQSDYHSVARKQELVQEQKNKNTTNCSSSL